MNKNYGIHVEMGKGFPTPRSKPWCRFWRLWLITPLFLMAMLMMNSSAFGQSADFTQAANETKKLGPGNLDWINSILNDNNSRYYEGMSTLQRLILVDIPDNPAPNPNTHTFRIKMEAAKASNHAYDFLTSWQQSMAAANLIEGPAGLDLLPDDYFDAGLNICGEAIPATMAPLCAALHTNGNALPAYISDAGHNVNITGDIPANNTQAVIAAYEAKFGQRYIMIYSSAPITNQSVAWAGFDGTYIFYDVTWTSDSPEILLEFAAHIAVSLDPSGNQLGYGIGQGASDISGGPYHVICVDFQNGTEGSIGNLDNQLMGSNVFTPPPTCTVGGELTLCANQTGNYSTPALDPSLNPTYAWTIIQGTTNATITGATNQNTVSVNSGTLPGSFTIRVVVCTTVAGITDCSEPCEQTVPVTVYTLTCPTTANEASCQTQEAIDAKFATWLGTVTYDGPGSITMDPLVPVAPSACGGSTSVTFTVTDECAVPKTCTATFNVAAPPAVVVTQAVDAEANACDLVDQAAAQTAFDAWLATATVSGGCDPTSTPDVLTAPDYCGGSVLVKWIIADYCFAGDSYSATYTINPPAEVLITKAVDGGANACDLADQAAAQAAFDLWLATASVSGGCEPTSVPDILTAPAYCGGSVVVTWTIADHCFDGDSYSATYTITPPAEVVITKAVDAGANACDLADQAAAQAAFDLWLATASVSGGCEPTSVPDILTAPAYCGGSVVVTWTIADHCFDGDSYSATYTITPPAEVVITKAVDAGANACDLADQAAAQAAFDLWLATASVSGGCEPTSVPDILTAPAYCGGSVVVTWTIADHCFDGDSYSATYTITPPAEVVITKAVDAGANACDLADQAAAQTAFDLWLATASVSGGCEPTSVPDILTAPAYCGGSVVVTWTIADHCFDGDSYSATYTITPPAEVVITKAVDAGANACDLADQAAAQTAFDLWLATASVSGGCEPTSVPDILTAPAYCGGSVTVTWTIADHCFDGDSYSATYTITPPAEIVVTKAVDGGANACDLADQAAAQTAFDLWLATATVSGGCKPTSTPDIRTAPAYCGGSVVVTWTIADHCFDGDSYSATYTITPPAEVVITKAVDAGANACDLADQAAAQTAFDLWLATASVSGGCEPTSVPDILTAPAYCGGSVTVTWTIADHCFDGDSYSATYTITPPAEVVITKAVDAGANACDLADQAAAQAAFDLWLATASVSGGCEPTSVPDILTAPAYCGGSVVVTWTIADHCFDGDSYSATYTITPPAEIVVTKAVDGGANACDLADQAAAQTAFDLWLATATVSGGCKPTSTPDIRTAPAYCGGSVTVTWTIADHCFDGDSYSATYTITPPAEIVVTKAVDGGANACDLADQAAAQTAFDLWLATASVSGGCKPTSTPDIRTAPAYCGGSVTVTWTIADHCFDGDSYSATYTITPPAEIVVTKAVDGGANACDLADQAAAQTAFDLWLATATVSGGCKPTSTPDILTAPAYCGGSVTVTWTIADHCFDGDSYSATYTITPPAEIVVTKAVDGGANACDLADQAAAQTAFDLWLATATVSGGCKPTSTPDIRTAPAYCGGSVTVTWTIADHCFDGDSYSATYTITPPAEVVITKAVDAGANACDLADQAAAQAAFDLWLATASVSGGCEPTSVPDILTAPAYCGGSVVVTWTIADHCFDGDSYSATYTITPPAEIVVTKAVDGGANACDLADQAAAQTAFDLWLATATVSGGCKPTSTPDIRTAPAYCGGSVTVTWTIADHCFDGDSYSATYTITPPAEIVVTKAVDGGANACDLADQAAAQTAFDLWLATASVSGGCKPTSTPDIRTAPAYCGGSVTVTWTIADHCFDGDSYSATYTITPPAEIVVTKAVDGGANACDLADQAAAQTAFDLWLATATVSGGCKPTSTPDILTAPAYCGGSVTVTWTIADHCFDGDSYSATYTITPPAEIVVTKAVDGGANACDLADQAAAQTAFDLWLATATVSGGCKPTSTPDIRTAPAYCGGSVTVTWTIADHCFDGDSYSATYTITPPAEIVVTKAVDGGANACDLADQAAAQTAFDLWLATATVSGGCKPTSTPDIRTAPAYCGGSVTVTWTIADHCFDGDSYSATYTITPPAEIVVTKAVDGGANACDLADQAAAQTAFDLWLATATVSGGCKPTSTPDILTAPAYCGGSVTVTWTIADHCFDGDSYSATYTITPPAEIVVTKAVDGGANACDLADQAAAQTAFDLWLATASVSGGCEPTSVPDILTAPAYCGGSVTVTWTIADHCFDGDSYSATYTITPPAEIVVTKAVDGGANACDLADQAAAQTAFDLWLATATVSGGCKPTSTPDIRTAPAYCGGSVTVTWTIADHCFDGDSYSATYTITPPAEIVVTKAVDGGANACDLADQAAAQTAFDLWLATATVSGGCKPTSTPDIRTAPAYCGGSVTVTWTIADHCFDGDSYSATYTITPPAEIVVTKAVDGGANACDLADQAAAQTAFDLWLATASVSGGCEPTSVPDILTAPAYCGGSVVVTWTIADHCFDGDSYSATYTITPPAEVVITKAVDAGANACDLADQAAAQTAFDLWLATASVSGGCEPTSVPDILTAPAYCGGSVVVTWTIADHCFDGDSYSATYTITPPAEVVITKAVDAGANACDLADQAAAQTAFDLWLATASVSGGCEPTSVPDILTAPAYCGGSVTVTWTIADHCFDGDSYSATYTITPPAEIVVTKAVDGGANACDLADQAAAQTAFDLWLATATVSGGCKPTSTPDIRTAPAYCGGSVVVTWTIADHCFDGDSYSATYTITPPAEVVITKAVDAGANACDLADQAAAQTAFDLWLATASVSGGCEPTSVPDILTAPAYCGGSVTVTWTIADHCFDGDSYSATYTITPPAEVVITKAVDAGANACDLADQAAAQAAFDLWLATASVSGGCEPTSVPDILTAPAYCGGSVVVTWTIADHCFDGDSYSATYTITPPAEIVVTKAVDGGANACDLADQAAAQTAFDLWLATATVSGGCKPTSTPDIRTAPAYCGGSVTVTWTIADHCFDGDSYSATYTITPPAEIVVTKAVDGGANACDLADQAAAQTAFDLWLATATVSGGCKPTSTPDIRTAPAYCGGSVVVTWRIADHCFDGDSYSATYTITPPAEIVVTKAVDGGANACDLADQAAAQTAFDLWLATATVSGGCKPTSTPDIRTAPAYCGGSVTVTWTIADHCFDGDSYSATYTITPPAEIVVTKAVDGGANACDLADQAAAQTAFDLWLATATVSGGCKPTSTPDIRTAPAYCGGSVTVTWTIADHCFDGDSYSATYTITPPAEIVVTKAVDGGANACDLADQAAAQAAFDLWLATASVSGGCEPTSVPDILTAPAYCGGSVVVTWTIADHCFDGDSYSATYTITPPAEIVVTKAVDGGANACDLADQAAAQTAFDLWLATATVSGGCKPTSTPDIRTAPAYCGGSVTVTWTIADHCFDGDSYSATYTITPPAEIVVTKAVDGGANACDLADQAAAQTAFDLWLATATVSGGCKPTSTPDIRTAPAYCGGSVTVTWTIADHCFDGDSYSATYTITPPAEIVVTKAVDGGANACDLADQAAAQTAFDLWLATATVSGGCKPTSTPDIRTAPAYCGGSVVVTWRIADHCFDGDSYSATYTITPPAELIITCSADYNTVPGEDATRAFELWIAGFTISGGCNPVTTDLSGFVVPACGESLTIQYSAEDVCGLSASCTATFTVAPCEFCTYTMGKYGNQKNSSACDLDGTTPTKTFVANLLAQGPLVLGAGGNTIRFLPGDAGLIDAILPGGGDFGLISGACTPQLTPACLNTYLKAKQGTLKSGLIAQTLTLGLNLRINAGLTDLPLESGYLITQQKISCEEGTGLVEMVCVDGIMTVNPYWYYTLNGTLLTWMNGKYPLTVGGLYQLANDVLGKVRKLPANITLSTLTSAVDLINNAFDECRAFAGYNLDKFTCEKSGQLIDGNMLVNSMDIKAYPNPFSDMVAFEFVPDTKARAILELYNILGEKIDVLMNRQVEKGVPVRIEYQPRNLAPGVVYYRLILDGKTQMGKVVYMKTYKPE